MIEDLHQLKADFVFISILWLISFLLAIGCAVYGVWLLMFVHRIEKKAHEIERTKFSEEELRIIYANDSFPSRVWAILKSAILHPFVTTIIRVKPKSKDT